MTAALPESIRHFLETNDVETPCLVVDPAKVQALYRELAAAFSYAGCHYAVKANPAPDILKLLVEEGSRFDVASLEEIHLCLAAGAKAEQLVFGNTIKRPEHIAEAHRLGVRRFMFDCQGELEKIARNAPGAEVFCRVAVDNRGAAWPLAAKFGCSQRRAFELMQLAQELEVAPYGISFHVGSQQTEPTRWEGAIALSAELFSQLKEVGIELKALNIGGGYPVPYREKVPPIGAFGEVIQEALQRHFGKALPEIIIEPGRYIAGEAGVLVSEVLLIRNDPALGDLRWVYLDVGKFTGLVETEAIHYEILTDKEDGNAGPVVLAGPTCDSIDVIYELEPYSLPLSLEAGDRCYFLSAGAYTTTYSSIGFNGFPPLKSYYTQETC